MPKTRNPRHGSMQYWPRKRAKRSFPRIRSWGASKENKPLGFAGYKVGMTHVMIVDNYGILHPPNAETRQLYYENGLSHIQCIFHYNCGKTPLDWYQFGAFHHSLFEFGKRACKDDNQVREWIENRMNCMKYRLVCKSFNELLPAPPMADMLNDSHKHSHVKAKL